MQEGAYARNEDPITSHEAADSIIDPSKLEALCLVAIAESPDGLTSVELTDKLELPYQTVSPRLRPLCNKGHIVSVGMRKNKSGRNALVWKVITNVTP